MPTASPSEVVPQISQKDAVSSVDMRGQAKNGGVSYDNPYMIKRCFRRQLFPSVLALAGGNISLVINNMVAGQVLGAPALAAMNLFHPIFLMCTTLAVLVCAGASNRASVMLGQGNASGANRMFASANALVAIAGALMTVVGCAFMPQLVRMTGANGDLYALTYEYAQGVLPGILFVMMVYVPLYFCRIAGRGEYGMYMFFIMAGVNIALDLLFVVHWGMGMRGLGLAMSLSSVAAVVSIFPLLFARCGYRLCAVPDFFREAARSIAVGSPIALSNVYNVIRSFLMNQIILTYGGVTAMAVFSFVSSMRIIAMSIISGMAQTVSPLTGVLIGEDDNASVHALIGHAIKAGAIAMLAFAVLITLAGRFLCAQFGLVDAEVVAVAIPALAMYSSSFVFSVINEIMTHFFAMSKRTGLANLITLVRGLAFAVPVCFVLAMWLGTTGVFLSFVVSEVLTLLVTVWAIRLVRRRHPGVDSLLLPVDMEAKTLAFAVPNDPDRAAASAEQVGEFCEACEMTPRQSMRLTLSIEEILVLIIAHALGGDGQRFIDVRIRASADETIVRYRYEGKRFNPIEYYKHEVESARVDELGEGLGMRLVTAAAKEVDYSTNLGVNNIIIKM